MTLSSAIWVRPRRSVRGDVEGKEASVVEPEAFLGPDQQDEDAEARQRLLQEGRMVGGGVGRVGRAVRGVDAKRPWRRRGRAK